MLQTSVASSDSSSEESERRSTLCEPKASGKQPGFRTNTFIFAAHPVGGNSRRMSCTDDRAEDAWNMLASPRSTQPLKVAGVGVVAAPADPILVLLVVQRLKTACLTSQGWVMLCYSCWTMKTASHLLALPSLARQVASAWLPLLSMGSTFLLLLAPTSDA